MIERILEIENFDTYLVLGILLFFGMLDIFSGVLRVSKRTNGDWLQEVISFVSLSSFVKPGIVLIVHFVGTSLFPQYRVLLESWNFWLLLLTYLLIDDVLQYWYHRLAHENSFLWKLHRPHHVAEEMGFLVSYRNALLYYLIMPNLWWVALITFLGAGKAVALGLILKQLVIISSHSTVKWDKPLYSIPLLQPFLFAIERIIVTPAFHHSHHGKSKLDSVSDPNGNFGNMFSIWDQLFGTARFTRSFPASYGLQRDFKDVWTASFLYPIIPSSDSTSEISQGFTKKTTATSEPISIELQKGKKYLWCQCGLSTTQPFCDGSHHGTKFKPFLFEAKKDGATRLCNCKQSKGGPFCDDSHLNME